MDLNNGLMIFNATFPVFSFAGDYVAKGHILNFQMTGDGKANITIREFVPHEYNVLLIPPPLPHSQPVSPSVFKSEQLTTDRSDSFRFRKREKRFGN